MYEAYITRIKDLRNHSNADRLKVGQCFGNYIIVGLDVEENQLGVYFPTDGQLGLEFAEKNNLVRKKDEHGNNIGGYLDEEKRNIKTIKLRGEKSDGLFLKLTCLSDFTDITQLKEGDKITVLNGVTICEKYIPKRRNTGATNNVKTKLTIKPTVTYPLFEEHVDTQQLAYNLNNFKEGDICYITLKLHGTSARTAYTVKKDANKNLIQKLLRLKVKPKKSWEYISGTRRVVLDTYKGGFYGDNSFREKWHNFFVDKLQKGEEVFYEIVGYTDTNKLIMSECNNSKMNDKEFVKKYGKTTKFTYGCEEGQNDIFVYRMSMTNEDGYTVDYPTELVQLRCEQMGVKFVPIFDKFIFTTREDLMERVAKFEEGADTIGKSHIREGIIVRIDNKQKFTAFKQKCFEFKVIEGLIKENATEPDMEEAQELSE